MKRYEPRLHRFLCPGLPLVLTITALTAGIVGAGCAHKPPARKARPAKVGKVASPSSLTADQASEDLKSLAYLLQTGYAGALVTRQTQVGEAVSALYAKGAKGEPQSSVEFCRTLAAALAGLSDPQVTVGFKGTDSFKPCVVESAKSQTRSGRNLQTSKRHGWGLYWRPTPKNKTVAVLALGSASGSGWKELPQTASTLRTLRQFVIDLRGSRNLDEGVLEEWLARLFSGERKVAPTFWRLQSPEALDLRKNYWEHQAEWAAHATPELQRVAQARVSETSVALSLAESSESWPRWQANEPGPLLGKAARGFEGTILVLIDRETSGSAEALVEWLEALFPVRKIGLNTRGAYQLGEPGLAILPNSGVLVQFGTRQNESRFGDVQGTGIAPDVAIPPGQDALKAALALIDGH